MAVEGSAFSSTLTLNKSEITEYGWCGVSRFQTSAGTAGHVRHIRLGVAVLVSVRDGVTGLSAAPDSGCSLHAGENTEQQH